MRETSIQSPSPLDREQSLKMLAGAFRVAPDATVICDADLRITHINQAFAKLFGYQAFEVVGRDIDMLCESPDEADRQRELRLNMTEQQLAEPHIVQYRTKSGRVFSGETISTMIRSDEDETLGGSRIICDVSDRLSYERFIIDARLKAERYLDITHALIVGLCPDGKVRFANQTAQAVLGYGSDEIIGLDWCETFLPPEEHTRCRESLARLCSGEAPKEREFQNDVTTRDGRRLTVLWHNTIEYDQNGRIIGTLSAGVDITDHEKVSEHFKRMALSDPLTGLPNRALLHDRLAVAVSYAERSGKAFSVLFLDLDGFKAINDHFGHETGDRVLRIVADRLRSRARSADTVARYGGDEFVTMLPAASRKKEVAAIAYNQINAVSEVIRIGDKAHWLSASIGIARYPDDGRTAEDLIKAADDAMYRAKALGPGKVQFSDLSAALTD